MGRASHATACMGEHDFLQAVDSVADLVPLGRAVRALRPEQQLKAWTSYAERLESRLEEACAQLGAARKAAEVRRLVDRESRPARAAGREDDAACDDRLLLLARLRAEQVMSLRLLDLLARYADLDLLSQPQGEAATVLALHTRRELRARDLAESIAEHRALRDAERAAATRFRDGPGATRLHPPGMRLDLS